MGAEGGLLAGKALCAERMVRAKYVGPVGPVGLVRRLALGCVCAVCSGISHAHNAPAAMLKILCFYFIFSEKQDRSPYRLSASIPGPSPFSPAAKP